ncbi:MAG: hemerythrin domain-containing protein [Firmicutes bacterium]|nr:hemerythrin domain-containing protein [Bacillota bacterium]
MDLISQLIAEHQDYVRMMEALAEVVDGIRVNGRGQYFVDTVDSLLIPFTTELDDHARREEEFLFPRLLERAPDSPIPVMLAEHNAIRAASAEFGRWYGVWRDGDDAAYKRWAGAALDLRGKFSAHMQKENLILFPLARRILTAGEIQQLTAWEDR